MQYNKNQSYWISFIIGAMLGVLFIVISKNSTIIGLFDRQYFENFSIITVDKMEYFKYVLANRLKMLILWFLIGNVRLTERCYEKAYLTALGIIGGMLGIVCSSIVTNIGIGGMGLFLALILPHGIFYYFCGIMIVKKRGVVKLDPQKNILIWILIILSLLLGVALESMFSSILVDKICIIV